MRQVIQSNQPGFNGFTLVLRLLFSSFYFPPFFLLLFSCPFCKGVKPFLFFEAVLKTITIHETAQKYIHNYVARMNIPALSSPVPVAAVDEENGCHVSLQ
jgi:glutaredoxin